VINFLNLSAPHSNHLFLHIPREENDAYIMVKGKYYLTLNFCDNN
jgi:hypothetical protein